MKGTEKIDTNVYALHDAQAIVALSPRRDFENEWGEVQEFQIGDSKHKIMYWGKDNQVPQRREFIVSQNNITPALLGTKRDIILGGGLMAYREREDDDGKLVREPIPMPAEVEEWLEKTDIDRYLMCACRNLMFHANVFTEFIMNKGGKVSTISAKQAKHIRAGEKNDKGVIPYYYFDDTWKKRPGKKRETIQIAGYQPKREKQANKFIYQTGDDLLTDEYYYIPSWWGGKTWIELANKIPAFHHANLKHGYTIRYHIELPKDYFYDHPAEDTTKDSIKKARESAREKKQEFIDEVNEFLAGETNTGRALWSTYEMNRTMGKEFPGIKITPIKTELQDKALLELFEKSNQANISSQAIHPTLANIETQGKLSSGSEIRNAFLLYLAIKAPLPRRILLRPLELVRKMNGWGNDFKFGFRDIELAKLDDDKSGRREVITEGQNTTE